MTRPSAVKPRLGVEDSMDMARRVGRGGDIRSDGTGNGGGRERGNSEMRRKFQERYTQNDATLLGSCSVVLLNDP
jgi:hypothetical protein